MINSREQHVVVVGGGLAGLASTVWLAELGYSVSLLETNGSLGGRTIGLTSGHGDAIENGQHVLAGCYENIFRYLESIGTQDLLEFPDEFGMRYPGGHVESFGMRLTIIRRLTLGQVEGLSIPTLLKATPAWARLVRAVIEFDDSLDDITVDQWLDKLRFPAEVRRIVLNPMVVGLLNEVPQRASAHAFAALLRTGADRVRRMGIDAARIGYPTVDLETLFLSGARAVMAERGVEVRLRTRAVSVRSVAGPRLRHHAIRWFGTGRRCCNTHCSLLELAVATGRRTELGGRPPDRHQARTGSDHERLRATRPAARHGGAVGVVAGQRYRLGFRPRPHARTARRR